MIRYKKLIPFFFLLLVSTLSFSQILEPVKWTWKASTKEVKIGDEIELIFTGTIDVNWYVYAIDFDHDCGPIPASFSFEKNDTYRLVGDIIPIGAKSKMDDIFGCEVSFMTGKAEFHQKVKVLKKNLRISGEFEYQTCSEIDGKCISNDEEFLFSGFKVMEDSGNKTAEEPKAVGEEKTVEDPNLLETKAKFSLDSAAQEPVENERIDDDEDIDLASSDATGLSLWAFILLAFTTGLAALLTPCVFPMIPMTVTFFLKDGKGDRKKGIKKGITFGLSIIFIYTLLGTLFAIILGADGLNAMATHWLPNIFITVIFLIFALSFLGMFEITLPSSWVNKVDQKADRTGGLVGIFFMAFTLGLVSFSCTVPIVGSVLLLSAGGEIIKPILGMLAFSMAFAIPFSLFAIFPEWLKSLPKSGGWLNSVKVVLGFLELALALKFLSIADQAYHWRLLDRDIYIALWIVIFGLMGLYLLGKIRLPNDGPMEKIGVPRFMFALLTFTFVVYLIPGMFGAPLKFLAGYLPPMSSHDFDITAQIREYSGSGGPGADIYELCENPKYADGLKFPHGIKGYFDYEQALKCAKEQNKPIFIDFTGHGCVNCREMEARVWSDPEVLRLLNENFIMLALYVDDKKELPESEWYVSEYDGKVKKSIGKQNADLQITRFNNNAQPYYILLGTDEKVLVQPKAYDLSVSNFVEFLDAGVERFNRKFGREGR